MAFPESRSGDLDPVLGSKLDSIMETAIVEWVRTNTDLLTDDEEEDEPCIAEGNELASPAGLPGYGPEPNKSAKYWLGCAKDPSHSMPERLFYMEQAYNAVRNELEANRLLRCPEPGCGAMTNDMEGHMILSHGTGPDKRFQVILDFRTDLPDEVLRRWVQSIPGMLSPERIGILGLAADGPMPAE